MSSTNIWLAFLFLDINLKMLRNALSRALQPVSNARRVLPVTFARFVQSGTEEPSPIEHMLSIHKNILDVKDMLARGGTKKAVDNQHSKVRL